MMSWIWTGCMGLALVCALGSGQANTLAQAALEGAAAGAELALSLAGTLCLWSGLRALMEQAGWLRGLSRALGPLLRWLYPSASPAARESISANMAANLLGLGNAATPPGIQAVRQMADGQATATDEMCMLIVVNTASIQLLPATVAGVRAGLGAAAPFSILPAVWLSSACSVSAGVCAARLLARLYRRLGR